MSAPLPLTWQAAVVDDDGALLGFVLAETPEDAPHDVREGLTRRRLTALHGRCPCGAQLHIGSRAQRRRATRTGVPARGFPHAAHRPGCPAGDGVLDEAINRWQQGSAR
jgi:hypothetical protein